MWKIVQSLSRGPSLRKAKFDFELADRERTIRTRASCIDCEDASRLVVESSVKHERMICVSKR